MTTNDTFEDGESPGIREHHVDTFLEHLRKSGYSDVTLVKKRRVLNACSRWMRSKSIDIEHLNESDIAAFANNLPGSLTPYFQFKLSVLRLFLAYLRAEAKVRQPFPTAESEADCIHRRYVDHQRQVRGLAENSVLVYAPFIRDFLDSQNGGMPLYRLKHLTPRRCVTIS